MSLSRVERVSRTPPGGRRKYVAGVPEDIGPRQWTTQPKHFGKSREIAWQPSTVANHAEVRAAQHQHRIVLLVRHLMQEAGIGSYDELAQHTSLSTAQVARILRGQSALSLKTIAELERALKQPLIGPPKPREE